MKLTEVLAVHSSEDVVNFFRFGGDEAERSNEPIKIYWREDSSRRKHPYRFLSHTNSDKWSMRFTFHHFRYLSISEEALDDHLSRLFKDEKVSMIFFKWA